METSVSLQEPFSYAIWPLIVLGVLIGTYLLYLIIYKIIKSTKGKKVKEVPKLKLKTAEEIAALKKKYIKELDKIETDLSKKKITVRAAYHRMSICIRQFVYGVTDIKVQNYTLNDIRGLNMPVLEELITEYYAPEFSRKSVGDAGASIEKTKRAIEKWN